MTDEIQPILAQDKCSFHPDVEAFGICVRCNKKLCETCAQWLNGRVYCVDCYADRELEFAAQEQWDGKSGEWYQKPAIHAMLVISGFMLMFLGASLVNYHFKLPGYILITLGILTQMANIVMIWTNKIYETFVKLVFTVGILLSFVIALSILIRL